MTERFKGGERVYEIDDGGFIPLRVLGQCRRSGHVLTRLDPLPGPWRDQYRRPPRLIVFQATSLARYT